MVEAYLYVCAAAPKCMGLGGGMGLTSNVEEDLHQWISVLGCIRQGALSKQVFRVQILSISSLGAPAPLCSKHFQSNG